MLKGIDNIDCAGRTVLVRVDLNSDIHGGRVMESPRLLGSLDTIRELSKKKARVVLLAHQGRPGSWDYTNLKQHAELLRKHIPLIYVPDVIGEKAKKAISGMKDGQIVLLDNVRSVKDEFNPRKKSNSIIQALVPLASYYVNDAFSVSHREQTTVTGLPRFLKGFIGRLMERELEGARRLNVKKALLVLGGSKPEDNIVLAKKFNKNKILANGLFGPYCLAIQGVDFGRQNEIFGKLPKMNVNRIITPVDFAIDRKGRKEIGVDDLPVREEILDIGSMTIKSFSEEIKKSEYIFFKGLSGLCNTPDFSIGTYSLLKALESSKGFSVVCGGHTTTMIERFKINTRRMHVSLAGGALVHYLAGEKLPGLKVLE